MKGTLYVITNKVNGKQYIGKTYKTVEERFLIHVQDSKKERNKNRKLYQAMNEFGVDNFYIMEIGQYEESELERKEIEYIHYYDTYRNGYNQTLGGDGKRYVETPDEEFVRLYRELGTLKAVAKVTRHDVKTIRGILHSYGITIDSKMGSKTNSKAVKINELNLSFNSIGECATFMIENNYTKAKKASGVRGCIGRVLTGKRTSYNGLTFSYE